MRTERFRVCATTKNMWFFTLDAAKKFCDENDRHFIMEFNGGDDLVTHARDTDNASWLRIPHIED